MKLFYVMGGGWGHLYRVHTFIRQFAISDFKILSNNPLAQQLFSTDEVINVPGGTREEVISHIHHFLNTITFDELYVDTFPAGLFGELRATHRKSYYLARRLKWKAYQSNVRELPIRFDTTFCVEELEPAHHEYVKFASVHVASIALEYPPPHPERIPTSRIPVHKPLWLVVHSFDKEEVETLLYYAQTAARMEKQHPSFVVLSDQTVDDPEIVHYAWLPACDWFPIADRIFTGGGFNVLQQVKDFTQKVTAIPFPRQYDDQAWRIRQLRLV
ncbi:MAG: hypothetical protein JNM57_01470 [Cyclobacteriaceae bacterium]|nr:hypothetical protein [Cyclobacteriaceae bacterium]